MAYKLEDLYAFCSSIEQELRAHGKVVEADSIETAMAGTTSGEILGSLWFALEPIGIRRDEVERARRYIEEVLGPPSPS